MKPYKEFIEQFPKEVVEGVQKRLEKMELNKTGQYIKDRAAASPWLHDQFRIEIGQFVDLYDQKEKENQDLKDKLKVACRGLDKIAHEYRESDADVNQILRYSITVARETLEKICSQSK